MYDIKTAGVQKSTSNIVWNFEPNLENLKFKTTAYPTKFTYIQKEAP